MNMVMYFASLQKRHSSESLLLPAAMASAELVESRTEAMLCTKVISSYIRILRFSFMIEIHIEFTLVNYVHTYVCMLLYINPNQNTPGIKKVAAKHLKKAMLKKM